MVWHLSLIYQMWLEVNTTMTYNALVVPETVLQNMKIANRVYQN
jgi:hypothetical protein